jgi:hypothetical protein
MFANRTFAGRASTSLPDENLGREAAAQGFFIRLLLKFSTPGLVNARPIFRVTEAPNYFTQVVPEEANR